MTTRTVLILAVSVLSAGVFSSGCVFSVGGHGDPCKPPKPTQGQELIDLKKAHNEGALTDAEYEAAKARALAQ